MSILFEHGNWISTTDPQNLKSLLREVWANRPTSEVLATAPPEQDAAQPFLTFDGEKVRARNYVGFVQNEDELIEIYPKVFRSVTEIRNQKELMLRHIFFWFDYCRKWRFPFTQSTLETDEIVSFPELIINLIARQFLDAVSSQPLHLYQPVEDSLCSPKGSINFTRYVSRSLSTGNLHVLECDHEPFLYDNKVNRIIKYCTRLLIGKTRVAENVRLLQEVIFILDEVDDALYGVADVDSCMINPFFDSYNACLQSCRLILSHQLYSSRTNDLSQWCLLFPMEYIFEDFIAGFLDERFGKDWKVEYQKSEMYLVDNPTKTFRMLHDILLTSRTEPRRSIIVDAKYKVRDNNFKDDPKRGVSQSDLYQMVSYAYKRGCTEVLLVYPNISEVCRLPDTFHINSGFDGVPKVNITAAEIPFWSATDFEFLTTSLHSRIAKILDGYLGGLPNET